MRAINYKSIRISIIALFLFNFTINYAQQSEDLIIPSINLVPKGLTKSSFQSYNDKCEKLKAESGKLIMDKKLLDQNCISIADESPEGKKCKSDLAILKTKSNELSTKIDHFNTEIQEVIYKDQSMDKLSIITYYTLNKDQQSWDEFQKNIANEKIKLKKEKVKVLQELTKLHSKKLKTKEPFNEGVILSMYSEQDAEKALAENLKSPFTGETYKEMNENRD
jgi:hypothetical protein